MNVMDPLTPKPEVSALQSPPAESDSFKALAQQCQRLEKLLIFTLAAFIVTTVCMSFFIARTAKTAKLEANRMSAVVERAKKDKIEPIMREFVSAMQQYAAVDKGFGPIWQKYQPGLSNLLAATKSFAAAPETSPTKPAATTPKK